MLPNFLIVGAMKAGTTTLYDDLCRTPGVYMPPEKEPESLAHPEIETEAGLARYAEKFRAAGEARAIGEASTAYTKRPLVEGVAERAVRVLGRDLRIIQLRRDPIARIVSHYHHELAAGRVDAPINEAVLADPAYVAFSRYDYQLEPWRAVLPADNILVIEFESYLAYRRGELERVRSFLGLQGPFDVAGGHRNASAGKAVVRSGSLAGRLIRTRFYQYGVKPLMPQRVRDGVRNTIGKRAPASPGQLLPETIVELSGRLRALAEAT